MGGEQDLRRESELVERQTWDMSEEQQKASFEHWPKKFECVSYSENNLFKLYNWPHLCMCVCVCAKWSSSPVGDKKSCDMGHVTGNKDHGKPTKCERMGYPEAVCSSCTIGTFCVCVYWSF